jgi:hypothetical protein
VGFGPGAEIAWSSFEYALDDNGFPATACIPHISASMPSLSRSRPLPHSRGAKRSTAEQADLRAPTSITTLLIGRAKSALGTSWTGQAPSRSVIGPRCRLAREYPPLELSVGGVPAVPERIIGCLQRDDLLRAYPGYPAWFAERSAVLGLAAAATSHLRSDESEKARVSTPHEGCQARIPGRSTMASGSALGERTGSDPGKRVLRGDRETAWSDGGRGGGRALLQRLQHSNDRRTSG